MPWLRVGDTSANHPIVLSPLEHEEVDDRLINEVFGFVVRCAAQSTAHLTDYVINRGTALAVAGLSRADALLRVAIFAGYMTKETRDLDDGSGSRVVYKIVDDPEFIHMRTKDEIEFERQRKKDNSDPALTIPVRLRDGDACRYCGLVVNFRPGARKGRIVGTYDHRRPGQQATVDTYVVACQACNSGRGDHPNADEAYPLRPAPEKPYYHPYTIKWISENDWAKRNGIKPPKAPAHEMTPGQHAPSNGTLRPGAQDSAEHRVETAETVEPQSHLQMQSDPAGRESAKSGFTGTGRGGTGRVGTEREGTALDGSVRNGSPALPKPSHSTQQAAQKKNRSRPRRRK